MAYQALYRKWRPARFEDVCGQSHITETLKKQIKNNKIGHAYLFTGTRGTGKTTCAKIMAKAVNCLNPKDGEPCGECQLCKMAENDTLYDIVEIDAASKSKVDDVRRLIEEVVFAPSMGKYKVYIIDEVHMMTGNAFNALLKTLEEPPEHTVFILATTEVQKIPATIMSRCQRFDFKRLSVDIISDRLKHIAAQDNINLTDDAAKYLGVLADGALRDGLSLLEQCQTYDEITVETVRQIVGLAGIDDICEILEAVKQKNYTSLLSVIDRLYNDSKKMESLVSEVMDACRDILLIQLGSKDIIARSDSEIEKLSKISSGIEKSSLMYWIDVLSACSAGMAKNTGNKTVTEVAFIKMCDSSLSNDISALADRVSRLESGWTAVPVTSKPIAKVEAKREEKPAEAVIEKPSTAETVEKPKEIDTDIDLLASVKEKLNSLPETMSLAAFLPQKYDMSGNEVKLIATNFNYTFLNTPANIAKIQQCASEVLGANVTVKIIKGE